jgi:hypothetical protein
MDSVGTHVSERNLRSLVGNMMIAPILPAHTMNRFQAFNIVFFGVMKNNKDHLANEPDAGSIPGQIWKLVRACEQIMTSFTI